MKIIYTVLFFGILFEVHSQTYTAKEVIELIKQNVTCEWQDETVDNIKAGSGDTKITGIATTFMATMEVLKKAVIENCNLIITHEPTFYNHFDDLKMLETDPVQKAKLAYIEANNLVVFRFHDHIHRTSPDGISAGVIKRLGWESFEIAKSMLFEIPKNNLKGLSDDFANLFNSEIIRYVGDPNMEVQKVKLILGAAGSRAHFNAFMNEDFDVLVVGEAQEWEAIPYVADASNIGLQKGLIVLGHTDSEEAGMDYCADWLKNFIPNLPIKFVPSNNPMKAGKVK